MLEIKNLSIDINGRYLVENLNVTLNLGEKLAIIGEEGNGKSSILKAIVGKCSYANVTGQIISKNNRIGYMQQTLENDELEIKTFDYIFLGLDDYYEKISDFYKYSEELNFDEGLLEQTLKTLSGGEKVKASIIKILLANPDVLLLDEPTNDLDIETLEWLENFINGVNIPIMFVSHDETLLSRTANMILHLEQINDKTKCKYTLERTGYDAYVDARIRKLNHQTMIAGSEKREFDKAQAKLKQVMNKVEYQQNTISRGDPHGARLLKKKMHSLKSQEKKLNSTILTEIPEVEEAVNFFFESDSLPNGKVILKLDIPLLKVKDRVLSKNIKLDVVANEHICIIGKNGVGKTTLMKLIEERLSSKEGINLGIMPQDYDEVLSCYEFVLDFLTDKNKDNITRARTRLASMNFTQDEVLGKIENLSNGSKAKLILTKLVIDECNVLLLDEPTRNTSPLTNPVIRKVLRDFKGTIISVSHDRKYLSEVVDRCYNLTIDGLKEVDIDEET